jgi:DNA transposition AAA+ family ATPase
MDAHRILGESRMIRTETDPKDLTEQDVKEVIDRVRSYLKERGVKHSQVAKAIMVAPSVVSQILSGTYAADPRGHIMAMDRWLERATAADATPDTAKFVWTGVARQIRLAAQRAIDKADKGLDGRISLVWGDPGCGKTLALEAVAETENGILIQCDFHCATASSLLEKIARSMRPHIPGTGRKLKEALTERLRGSGKLIIVDEIHALLTAKDDNPFHTLRRLSDETGCPQLWAASCDLVSQLRLREQRREPLSQIIRRIGTQFHLTAAIAGQTDGGRPLFTVEEIIQIYGRNEMRLSRDAAKFLARLTTDAKLGLLGTCTELVADATTMNRAQGGEITVEMLWESAQLSHQASEIELIYNSVREELPARQRRAM